jgi:hypothetical protein
MAYCRQCAAQLSDSDMFCTVCGAPQSPGASPLASPRTAQPNERLNEIIKVATGMLSKPVSCIRSVTTIEFSSMAILGGIIAVVTGLLVMWMIGAAGDIISDLIPFGSKHSLTSDLPWGKIFAYSLFGMIVFIGALFTGLLTVGKLMFKSTALSHQYFNVAVASTIPTITALAGAILLSYIYAPIGLLVFDLGTLISIICVYMGLKEISYGDDDRLTYGMVLVFLIYYIILFIFGKIIVSSM